MPSPPFTLTFVPFVRPQLSAWASQPDRTCGVAVKEVDPGDGAAVIHDPVPVELRLLEPRHIAGLAGRGAPGDPIAGVSPAPGAAGVAFTTFPSIDFKDLDFPWRYSYASRRSTSGAPSSDGPRLAPWLILLVLRTDQYDLRSEPVHGDPSRIARFVRPRPGAVRFAEIRETAWAWAHVQLSGPREPGSLGGQLARAPAERVCSRLVCPVYLQPDTAYSAFLIPADNEAWSPDGEAAGTVDHPIFHAWSFSTGALPDFESLLARIERGQIEDCALTIEAGEHVDLHGVAAGHAVAEGSRLAMPGALQPAGAPAWRLDAARPLLDHFHDAWLDGTTALQGCSRCRHIARLPLRDCEGAAIDGVTVQPPRGRPHPAARMTELDPYVGLPCYGSFHAGAQPVPAPGEVAAMAGAPWPYEVNIATRRRVAAGLGAEVLRQHQDELVARYAAQLAAQERAETVHRARELGRSLNGGLWRRHGGAVDAARYVARVAPVAARADVEPLHRTALAHGALSPDSRKILHQKVGRRAGPAAPAYRHYLDRRLTEKIAPAASPAPARVYDVTIDDRVRAALGELNDATRVRARTDRALATALLGEPPSVRGPAAPLPRIDLPMYRYLMALSRDYLIPRLDTLPSNRLALLQPDAGFIKAYLLGLNHEMVRELIWRGYPIAPTHTVFRHFWDKDDPSAGPDIDDLDRWDVRAPLDAPAPTRAAVRSAVLIKADLIQHCHDVIIRVVQASGAASDAAWMDFLDGAPVPGFETVPILFHCPLADDTVLLGLPIALALDQADPAAHQPFLIFSENPARPHFGLPLEQRPGPIAPEQLARNLVWGFAAGEGVQWLDPRRGLQDGVTVNGYADPQAFWRHSARVARCTLQRPVQLRVPFRELVARSGGR